MRSFEDGYYHILTESEDEDNWISFVFEDDVTLKKIVRTELFENGEYYMVALIYEDDGTYSTKKFSFSTGGGSGEVIIPDEVLNKTKEEAVIESKQYTDAMMTLNIL